MDERSEDDRGTCPVGVGFRGEVDIWLKQWRHFPVMRAAQYWVYILASHSRCLYVGSTSDLIRRLLQHRNGEAAAFCRRYRINRLVHWEAYPSHREVLARERQVKGWSRAKKIALIEAHNFGWLDLSADWLRGVGQGR